MDAFLPTTVGSFAFPAPYKTLGVRLTTPADGRVNPIGMSYWRNLNAHQGDPFLRVILSLNDQLTLLHVDKSSYQVEKVRQIGRAHTGEGCYWSDQIPTLLYVPHDQILDSYDAQTGAWRTVADAGGDARQWHSSADGSRHSCTLNGLPAAIVNGEVRVFPTNGGYDECQIDKSGRWLLVKAQAGNTIWDLNDDDAAARWVGTRDWAVGHSDNGSGFVVGEIANTPGVQAGAFYKWTFDHPEVRLPVYHMHGWEPPMTRYVSLAGDKALYASASNDDRPRANELVLGDLSGSLQVIAVCPNLTDLSGGPDDPYWRKVRPNMDVTGDWAIWTANHGTDRLDAFLVRLPHL